MALASPLFAELWYAMAIARDLEDGGPFMVAMCEGARVTTFADCLPHWVQVVLAEEGID